MTVCCTALISRERRLVCEAAGCDAVCRSAGESTGWRQGTDLQVLTVLTNSALYSKLSASNHRPPKNPVWKTYGGGGDGGR